MASIFPHCVVNMAVVNACPRDKIVNALSIKPANLNILCWFDVMSANLLSRWWYGVSHCSPSPRPKGSPLTRKAQRKKWRKQKVKNWPFWGDLYRQENFLAIFGYFLKKPSAPEVYTITGWFYHIFGWDLSTFHHWKIIIRLKCLPIICEYSKSFRYTVQLLFYTFKDQFWDIWSKWWGDMTSPLKRQMQSQRRVHTTYKDKHCQRHNRPRLLSIKLEISLLLKQRKFQFQHF